MPVRRPDTSQAQFVSCISDAPRAGTCRASQAGLSVSDGRRHGVAGSAPTGAAVIEGRAVDVVDYATGHDGATVSGDVRALAELDGLTRVLTG